MRPPDSYGHAAVISLSDWRTMVAAENAGCEGGGANGGHDTAATFHCRVITVGPGCVGGVDEVGAVGECEQPIAQSNRKPHRVRVTASSIDGGGTVLWRITIQELCQREARELTDVSKSGYEEFA